MRTLLFILIAVLLTIACGLALCAGAGWTGQIQPLLLAAAVCLVSAALATVPLMLTRHAQQPAVASAGLVGTVVHLLATVALATPLFLMVKGGQPRSFTYWLFAFYWVTLAVLVLEFVRAIRLAPPATASHPQ